MTVEHKLSYPDEAEVTFTIKCSVHEARRIAAALSGPSQTHPGESLLSAIRNAVRQAEATIYARIEEPKQST